MRWIKRNGWHVYTDRSDLEGRVGAAVVLVIPNSKPKVLRYHLGSADKQTMYEGKLVGLALGVTLLKKERSMQQASCAADNCASMQAMKKMGVHPLHYLVN